MLPTSNVVASKVSVLNTATGVFPCDDRLMLLGSSPGFISIEIGIVFPELPAAKMECTSAGVGAD